MKIAVVFGTRPEAVKVWKVVEELRRRGVEPWIACTGQHTSLLRGTPADDALNPNVTLGIPGNNDPIAYGRTCAQALVEEFRKNRPDVIVVQGDTASAYAGAVAGKHLEIPVAHIEAGVRTGDPWDPWPEENFRVGIDAIAGRRYAATKHALSNLDHFTMPGWLMEPDIVSGNPGIDALYSHTQPVTQPRNVQDRVIVTLHRRESFGEPLREIVRGLIRGANKYPKVEFWWPMHPNPEVNAAFRDVSNGTQLPTNLIVSEPLGMVPFARMLAASKAVITDSGGVQEESAALGIPCIVARTKTDRPESVALNLAKVVGRSSAGVCEGLEWALGFGARCTPSDCFGNGTAAPRIVEHLLGD